MSRAESSTSIEVGTREVVLVTRRRCPECGADSRHYRDEGDRWRCESCGEETLSDDDVLHFLIGGDDGSR